MNKANKLNTPYQVKSNLATYKEIDESTRTVKAVVNTYNYFDYDSDVLRKGCALKSIQDRGSKSNADDKILHALFHDLKNLAGKSMSEAETTINGKDVLYAESYLPETTTGEDTLLNYKAGIYNQHSIGFRYMQIDYIEKGAEDWDNAIKDIINIQDADNAGFIWNVTEIKWHEWSTVAFGANKLTPYLGTKSTNKLIQYESIIKKMDVLVKKANKHEVKNKKLFDLQYKQLQQMIFEIATCEPSKKDTLMQSRQINDTQPKPDVNGVLDFLTQIN